MAVSANDIQGLYIAYFNRPADFLGLQFWTDAANKAGGINTVANAFAASPEYTTAFAGKSTAAIIDQIYMNLFGRHAELDGIKFWGAALDNKVLGIGNIAYQIMKGAQDTVGGFQDATAVASKVSAATAFYNALDTAAEVVAYSGDAANALARTWLSTVVDQASLDAATTADALNAVTGSVVTAGTPAPTPLTFALTTGIDKFTGAAGDDVFNALATTGNLATLTSLDVLDGGAGNDTLNIVAAAAFDTGNAASSSVKNIETVVVTNGAFATTVDTSGWTGTTNLSVVSAADDQTITAADSTDVSTTLANGAGTATVSVDGGKNVTVQAKAAAITVGSGTGPAGAIKVTSTTTGANAINIDGGTTVDATITGSTSAAINVGVNTKASGAVNVTATTAGANTNAIGTITVKGGTAITVTEHAGNSGATGVDTAQGAVHITGGSTTTTVTVNQDKAQTGADAVSAVAAVKAVAAVTAAPGTQGVVAVTGVDGVSASAAVVGTTSGQVIITDANAASTTIANKISNVTLSNFAAGSQVNTNALTSLTLAGKNGTLAITNAAAAPTNTALTLNVNGVSGTNTITDTNNEISTLNVVTGASGSTLAAFADTSLTTLNISGASTFGLTSVNSTLTKIAVSGAAGFSGNVSALGSAVALTTTSSGKITATLDATTQTFVGSTGQDVITISADATKVITGGSGTTDELIVTTAATNYTAANTTANVTGFETLGVNAAVAFGTFDMANIFKGYKAIDVKAATSATFTGVASGSAMTIAGATTALVYQAADATGPADSVTINLGSASAAEFTTTSLTLMDANSVGLGTVNIVSNGVHSQDGLTGDGVQVITTLVDNGLSVLNVSGTDGLTIGTLNQATTQATSFTINNTETGTAGVTITSFTDDNLGSLIFKGSNSSVITTMNDANSHVLAISNTGTSTATITTFASTANLTNLTLSGNVTIGTLTDTSTAGVTVSGATDHAHVGLVLTGAATTKVDTITLGNGNNSIADTSTAGTVNVTVGTGSNLIKLGDVDGTSSNTAGVFSATLGTHTAISGSDYIYVTTAGTAYATVVNTSITGAVTGDRIYFGGDLGVTATGTLTARTAGATLAATITDLEGAVTAHGVVYAVFNGDTYVVESVAGSGSLGAADTTLIKIVGSHTLSATNDAGGGAADFITLLS